MGIKYNFIVQDQKKYLRRTFEFMTEKTMLVKLNITGNIDSNINGLNYWFLEKYKSTSEMKPPFEVAVNSDNGNLMYINFFLQDKEINKLSEDIIFDGNTLSGIPVFDISNYDNKNYQVFEEGEFLSYRNKNKLWVLNLQKKFKTYVKLDEDNFVIFDEDNFLVGVFMKKLTIEEMNILKKCELLD